MEARMDEDEILSMMRALLDAQQRGLASQTTHHHGTNAHEYQRAYDEGYKSWEPTGHDGFDGSSASHGDLYAHELPRGYDSGYHSWEPTCHHGWDGSSPYQGGLPTEAPQSGYDEGYHAWQPATYHGLEPSSAYHDGPSAPAHHSGFEEASQSWDMQYDNGGPSSPISIQEDHYNMMRSLLEGQARHNDLINSLAFGIPSTTPTAAATEHVAPFGHNLTTTPWTDEDDSDCFSVHETSPMEVPPIEMGHCFEEIAPHTDEFLQEAAWTVTEFELLLGCTVDENLVLSYDDPDAHVVSEDACQGGLVVDCKMDACESSIVLRALQPMEVIHMPPVYKLETKERRTEVASTPGHDTGIPLRHASPKAPPHPLGSLPTNETRNGHPWRLPYEQIRMNEFGGWFYDEYDPGDPRFCRVHLDKSA